MGLKNFLYSQRWFWRTKLYFEQGPSFNAFKRLYEGKYFLKDEKTSFLVLKSFLKSFVFYLLYGAFFVAIFELLNYVLPVKPPFKIDYEVARDLIVAIVTVVGVFLGLYFTAVSAVAGGLFMRATNNLQELFLRDWKSRQYIRTLGLTTVIGIYYLGLSSIEYKFSVFGIFTLILLVSYAAIRFVVLGFRTFYFIHPIEASATITGDAAYAIKHVVAGTFGWNKDYLQNHNRKRADAALQALLSLINFGVEAVKLTEEQLITIARYCAALLSFYLEKKKHIPSESFWFRQKQQFQKWIFADSNAVIMALNTGTSLSPKSIKDKTWFEEQCLDVILKLFDYFVDKKRWEDAHETLEILISAIEKIGEDFYDDVGKLVVIKIKPAIARAINFLGDPIDNQSQKAQLAIIDSYGRLGIGLLIGLLRRINNRSQDQLSAEINEINWKAEISVYTSKLPGKLLPKLEEIGKQYKTEELIEGTFHSPEWYMLTITAQQYLFELKIYFEFIKSLHADLFQKNVEELIKAKRIIAAAGLVERWLEFLNKLSFFVFDFRKLAEGCINLKKVSDLPWLEMDFAKESELIEKWKNEATDKLIFLMPVLSQITLEKSEFPDYFGQAYTFGVEACYEACNNNDAERFKRIFPFVFQGALSAYDSIRKETQGWNQDSQIIYSSEPLEDLLELSGYAKLYSELYQNPELWKVCEEVWTSYLANANAKNVIGLIAATASFRDGKFMIMPKAILRTNWDIKFRQKLQELNLVTDPSQEFMLSRQRRINHPSALIRIVGKYGNILPVESRDIFFATYLRKHEAAQAVEFPDRRDLVEQLENATSSDNEETDEDEV